MSKGKKTAVRAIASVLALTALLGGVGCGSTGGKVDDGTTTVIKVANFGGGIGRKWLDEAGERFAELVKDKEYETGKKGVRFDITNAIGVTCVGMKTAGTHIYFLQDKYGECFAEIQKGTVLDITDIVSEETLSEYGENVTIESKLDENYRFAMKGNDGKYYMLPHYETQSGASYDVDLFTKEGFYLAKANEGTAYNCELVGQTYYFTGEADEKTVGNDGKAGTDDDGMPTTLNELVAMCDYMMEEGVVPFSVAGSHIDYTNYLIEGLWTALAGYEQRNAVVAHTGTVEYVTGISDTELWAGSGIKAPVTETATNLTSATGYKAINQAARYYSYAFIELAYQEGWIYDTDKQREMIAEYMQKLENVVYIQGCKTEIEEYGFRPAMERAQRNLDLLDTVNEIFKRNGLPALKPSKKRGGSDAAQVTSAGIPCLDSLGVLGGYIHSPNEYAIKDSLKEAAKRLASIICCI